jgi:uncharacterized repeat protein (TIGR03803 family)
MFENRAPLFSYSLSTLASFNDSNGPEVYDLLADTDGDLFGETSTPLSNGGTVFELTKTNHTLETLATLTESPDSELISDAAGNLYGTEENSQNSVDSVFEVAAGTHALSTLATLGGPDASLVSDIGGNLYGLVDADEHQTVFEISTVTGVLSTLATFNNIGVSYPIQVIADAEGDLYGASTEGGPNNDGTVFEVVAGTHAFSTLASFNGTNGSGPFGLILDKSGNLFGVTGFLSYNDATIFEIPSGTRTLQTLATFKDGSGELPDNLIAASSGILYGSTQFGGASDDGTVFELTVATHAMSILVNFDGVSQGQAPFIQTIDPAGNLFGITLRGGRGGDGTIFEVSAQSHQFSLLASFYGTSGESPDGDLVFDPLGNIYGTTASISSNNGTVFELTSLAPSGWIDAANMNLISGWAYDWSSPSTPINVEVDISGGPSQTFLAKQTRPDLQSVIGSTNHGFTYSTPMLSAGSHTASIYALETDGSKVLLNTETLISQNSLFDEHYYLQRNPDVAAVVAQGTFATGYDHYLKYGQFEGRSPSPYWDESWYLQENPDVAAAVKAHTITSGFMHYYLYGQYENRPGLLYFSTSYYLTSNPDVAAAVKSGAVASAYEHFVDYGQYEGRSPMLYFSSTVYDADNPDILPYVGGEPFTSDFDHFIEYGQYEDRVASLFYNEKTYLVDNPDVAAAVKAGTFRDGFQHWLMYGQSEGRKAV